MMRMSGLGRPRPRETLPFEVAKSRDLQPRELSFLALWFLHGPVLHVAVDVGVELTASENAVETGGLGGG
jgi:hypothetical protein